MREKEKEGEIVKRRGREEREVEERGWTRNAEG